MGSSMPIPVGIDRFHRARSCAGDQSVDPRRFTMELRNQRKRVPPRGGTQAHRATGVDLQKSSADGTSRDLSHTSGFNAAVEAIATNCGPEAKRFLLSNHRRLPGRVIMRISRTHPDRQRFALEQARGDRNPLGKPPRGVAPPFDTHDPAEVLNRLARNVGALNVVADGLLNLPRNQWPAQPKLSAMLDHAQKIQSRTRRLSALVAKSGVIESVDDVGFANERRSVRSTGAFNPQAALRTVAAVAGITAKNERDLPRVLVDTPPTEAEQRSLLSRLASLRAAASRLAAVIRSQDHDYATGPSEVPGTYIVLFQPSQPTRQLAIGDLGTFDCPAGVYAYLGSAFGAGGVRKRTNRHLTRHSNLRWNIDHLKPHCTPVAVWWTHDRDKREFEWAQILSSMPGASFPAKGFGAGDNRDAVAHLVHFAELPSFTTFQNGVTDALPGHARISEIGIENWTGSGWPK
ncbi:MAG: hypothetical protein C0467_24200 [Planctomycetaceae bacterium]|nr:hypothetical protein [Planctomycetaceae bacterium]